jgi:hypothetical protein
MVAALLGPGDAEPLSQCVEQRGSGIDDEAMVSSIDMECDLDLDHRQVSFAVSWTEKRFQGKRTTGSRTARRRRCPDAVRDRVDTRC